jgi:Sugar (and other) transporter
MKANLDKNFKIISYFVLGSFSMMAFTFIYFLLPETKGKSIEEITQILKSNSKDLDKCTESPL